MKIAQRMGFLNIGKRSCTLLVFLFVFLSNAVADWNILTVNREKTVTIWIDSASLQRRHDSVFAWLIYDRADPAHDGAMSSKVFNQYDCANRQARTWRQSFYLKSMAGGEKLPPKGKAQCEVGEGLDMQPDDSCMQPWKPIVFKTTGADILDALCVGQAATRMPSPLWSPRAEMAPAPFDSMPAAM